jgi:hypothetical protein
MIAGSLGCGDSGVVSTDIHGASGSDARIASTWGSVAASIQAQRALVWQGPQPEQVSLAGQVTCGLRLAGLGVAQRRAPQAQQVSPGREVARVSGLPGADVLDGFFRRSVRNAGGHGDEVFHGSCREGCGRT